MENNRLEMVDDLVAEGYDYDSAWYMVFGDVPDSDMTNPDARDEAV